MTKGLRPSQRLSHALLIRLMEIVRRRYGVELTDEQARVFAERLFQAVALLGQIRLQSIPRSGPPST